MVDYFRITGESPQTSEPIERVVSTARHAELERSALQRLCGKHGKVEVLGKDGRTISPERLWHLAQQEESSGV